MKIQLSLISKYRRELMGVSALFILICHVVAYVSMPNTILYCFSFGNIGVDMFLYLSGMGMWYSLEKLYQSDKCTKNSTCKVGVVNWYLDRYKKLFIPYLMVFLSIILIQYLIGRPPAKDILDLLLYISTIRFYISHNAPWFIAALIPLYFVAPLMYRAIKKTTVVSFIIFLLILYAILFIPLDAFSESTRQIISNIQFVLVRATSFVMGMAMGGLIKRSERISVYWIVILVFLGLIAVFITKHLVYGYFFFTLPLLILACYLFSYFSENRIGFFSFLGDISLESYLFNGALPSLMILVFKALKIPGFNNIIPYLLACILGCLLSKLYKNISSKMLKRLS